MGYIHKQRWDSIKRRHFRNLVQSGQLHCRFRNIPSKRCCIFDVFKVSSFSSFHVVYRSRSNTNPSKSFLPSHSLFCFLWNYWNRYPLILFTSVCPQRQQKKQGKCRNLMTFCVAHSFQADIWSWIAIPPEVAVKSRIENWGSIIAFALLITDKSASLSEFTNDVNVTVRKGKCKKGYEAITSPATATS